MEKRNPVRFRFYFKSLIMYRVLLLLIISGTNLISCKTKSETSKTVTDIAKSYGLIHGAFLITKQVQEKFFGKATEIMGVLKNDDHAFVDTRELKLLLDSAKSASETRISMINFAEEIDDEIKYKTRALKFVMLLDTLYKKEFRQFIKILDSETDNKFQKCQTLLLQRMLDMQKAMYDCSDAGDAVTKKYNIQISDKIN